MEQEEAPLLKKPDPKSETHYSSKSRPFGLYSTLPYYGAVLIYLVSIASVEYLHNVWIIIWGLFCLLPILDFVLPQDWLNPTKQQEKELEDKISFKVPLYLTVVLDWVLIGFIIHKLQAHPEMDLVYWIGMLFGASISSAINFMSAHELVHKHDLLGQVVGTSSLVKSFYMHFYIEHIYGHHRNVGTPKDPATSRYNESFWKFLPRTMIGSWKSAWNYEKRRLLEIEGLSTHWSYQNRMLWFLVSYFLIPIPFYFYGGITGLIVLFISGVVSIIYFEGINYIEHYGLERKQIGPDQWEKVDIRHSWNAPHRMTNYLLFKLQRHSDHHENSYKPYQTLASYDLSPQLPNGYALCVMMAFYPPIWFKVMNPIVDYYKKGVKPDPEVTKAGLKAMWNYTYFMSAVFGTLAFVQIAQFTISFTMPYYN